MTLKGSIQAFALSGFAVLALAACSGGGGGGGQAQQPLLKEQSATFATVVNGIGRVERSAKATKNIAMMNLTNSAGELSTSPNSPDKSSLDNYFTQSLAQGHCRIETQGLDPLPPSQGQSLPPVDMAMEIHISGDSCPVKADYAVQFHFNMDQNRGSLGGFYKSNISFKILDPKLAEANEVSAMSVRGEGTLKVTGSGQQGVFELVGSQTGTIDTIHNGIVQVNNTLSGSIVGTQAGSNGQVVVDTAFKFDNFTAQLMEKHVYNGQAETASYALNGVALTKEDYQKYLSQLGMFGTSLNPGNLSDSQSSSDGQSPSEPSNPIPSQPMPGPAQPNPVPNQPMPNPQPAPQPIPAPAPGNDVFSCMRELKDIRPFFTPAELRSACTNADKGCVIYFAKENSYMTAKELQQTCVLP